MIKLIRNPLGEEIPEFMVANHNHTAKGAWAKNHELAPLGCSKGNTTAVGRATIEDIRTGWAGHLTTRQMIDQKNGMSGSFYESIRWGEKWISRSGKGWTQVHFLKAEWLYKDHYNIYKGFNNLGAPHWWMLSEHP